MRRRWTAPVIIAIVAVLIVADRQGWLLVAQSDDYARYHGRTFVVAQVIDGDTFEIEMPDPVEQRPTTRIRLWGIDCPETAHPGNPKGEPWADEASALTRELALNQTVTLQLEPSRLRGYYGRVLAHVDLTDGRRLNAVLLEHGLAYVDDRWPHGELMVYDAAERSAKAQQRGVWSANDEDQ